MASSSEPQQEMLERSSVTSFVQCVLELVANSLTAHSAAIAIRIHREKREIQVIDNGIGIRKDALDRIGECNIKTGRNQQVMYDLSESNNRMLISICRSSDSFTVASRHKNSRETFMKVYKAGATPNLIQIEQRPLQGTTVAVYGFHEVPMQEKSDINTICYFIAAVAVSKLEVSFSVRDEEQKRVALRIAKPHSPIDILKALFGKNLSLNHLWSIKCNTKCNTDYHGYIGLADKNTMQLIFLNDRLINCSHILKLIIAVFKESLDLAFPQKFNRQDLQDKNIFVLFFLTLPQDEFTFITENGRKLLIFHDVRKILNSVKTCAFKSIAEEITISTGISSSGDSQLLKRVTRRKSASNDISRHIKHNIASLAKRRKIVITGIKRKITASSVVTVSSQKRWNKSNDTKAVNRRSRQLDIVCAKYKQLCKNQATKKLHNNIGEMQTQCNRLAIKNVADQIGDAHNNKNHNFATNISLSEWSDWSYRSKRKECNPAGNEQILQNTFYKNDARYQRLLEQTRQFDFVPQKLYTLLRRRQDKVTNVKYLNASNSTISLQENWRHEKMKVHPCNLKERLCEFRLTHASLWCIKVINQINDEFIAAWMMYDGKKILLMMDQHAVHERIRYEDLLLKYKALDEGGLLSVSLRNPLAVEFPTQTCNLLLRHKMLLRKYGVSFGSLKKNTLLIRAVPQCLITSSDHCNSEKILSRIYGLLNDILQNCNAASRLSTLPLTIHNAIASEACHGAIKFGDKLTNEQCTSLIKLLRHTKFPNRCAHGRPTIIPIMELSELEKRRTGTREKTLNFASLKKQH